jgi:hypothetical protein
MAKREYSPDEAKERRLASRELGRAKRAVAAIRNFYIANAILWGVPLLFALLADAKVLAAILGAGFLFMVIGIFQVRKQPFLWAMLIAVIWTLYVLSHLILGGRVMSMGFVLPLLWTIGCWSMLATTSRMNDLLSAFPDLRVSQQLRPGGRRRDA